MTEEAVRCEVKTRSVMLMKLMKMLICFLDEREIWVKV